VHKTEWEAHKAAKAAEIAEWDRIAGQVIAASRKAKRISQQALADEIGWTRDQVASLERGHTIVRISLLIVIAKAIRESPEKLLHRILHWPGAAPLLPKAAEPPRPGVTRRRVRTRHA
jgi:transcriptional regulator with XRE-family HTH domain